MSNDTKSNDTVGAPDLSGVVLKSPIKPLEKPANSHTTLILFLGIIFTLVIMVAAYIYYGMSNTPTDKAAVTDDYVENEEVIVADTEGPSPEILETMNAMQQENEPVSEETIKLMNDMTGPEENSSESADEETLSRMRAMNPDVDFPSI